MTETRLELLADYHQILLKDEAAAPFDPTGWDDAVMAARVDVQGGNLVLFTVRNMVVPVTVAVLDAPPLYDLGLWDHVVECDIEVPTGQLVVMGLMDYAPDAVRIAVPPGPMQARVLMGRLAEVSADGLDGADHYRVELWPGPLRGVQVIKAFAGANVAD